jgi:hypothetical protein
MKTLSPRELATVRAALGLWSRTSRPSPHLAQQASGGDSFPPLDDSEVAELQEKLRDARVSMQPIDDDIVDFVRRVSIDDEACCCTPDQCPRCEWLNELMDEAQAIVRRLDD